MKQFSLFVIILFLLGCNKKGQNQVLQVTEKENIPFEPIRIDSTIIDPGPTNLPIRLEQLDPEKIKRIQGMNRIDTTSYLMASRPIVFQIQGVENDQDQARQTGYIRNPTKVLIYAVGEVLDSAFVDYGWIENQNGEKVWEMDYKASVSCGENERNRKVVQLATMPPGLYSLRYKSNSSHASGDWQGGPPEYNFYYGITVFNLKAIETIKRKFED